MQAALTRLGLWLWYLVPANPILVRVVQGASRRPRHLWLRFAYLGVLLFVVLIALMAKVGNAGGSLSELAKGASSTFASASVAQLALMCFLAPVFTAAAITQERDARTLNILLSTPLSNAQIVLGSLMSRLYFVIMLLIAGLPIFLITMVYGGVTSGQIFESFSLAGGTAVLTGSLAITISMTRVGTRRTILSFYLMIGLYLLAVYALGSWQGTWLAEAPTNIAGDRRLSWLAPFHPFLALEVALNRIPAPELGMVANRGWPLKYFYAYPQWSYVTLTLLVSVCLVLFSLFLVRRGAKTGESTFFSRILDRFGWIRRGVGGGERTRRARKVWQNPVAWREAATRASAGSAGMLRWVLLACGAVAGIWLFVDHVREGGLGAGVARQWLANLVMIEFGIALIVCTNAAATSMTRERESNTLDLLMTTPLTSKYIVFGKLRGLVAFALPLIAVPVVTVLLIAGYDLFTKTDEKVAFIETPLELAGLLLAFAAWACMLGLYVSLRSKRTVKAVMVSLSVLVLVLLTASPLWWEIVQAFDSFGAALAPATPYTAIKVLCDPSVVLDDPTRLGRMISTLRAFMLVGSAVAVIVVLLIVTSMYKSMVRNFDMTLRKQTAT